MTVCVARGAGPHTFFKSDEIEGLTTAEILAKLKVQDSVLAFENRNFWAVLESTSNPLEMHPELIRNENVRAYTEPEARLKVLPASLGASCGRAFEIKAGVDGIDFPLMMVTLPLENLRVLTAREVLDLCKETFEYETSNEELYSGDELIREDALMENFLEKAKQSPLTFNCNVSDAVQKKIKHRGHLAAEVLSSEESFVHDLKALKDYWEDAFAKKLKLTDVEMRSLFRDIPTLLRTHTALVEEMRSGSHGYDACYGALFLNYLKEFQVSCAFISNYKKMDEMLKEKKKKSGFFAKLSEIEDNNPDANGRDFQSYYITPVQRYPRYPLLLRDLNKQTPKFHPDKVYLQLALTEVDRVNKSFDNTSRRVKSLVLMQELSNELPEDFSLFDSTGREMLMNVCVRIVKPKMGSGMLYLFNDLVLFTAKVKKSQTPLVSCPIQEFRFANGKPMPESITIYGEEKEYCVTFPEMSDKTTWMETFNSYRNTEFSKLTCPTSYVTWTDVNIDKALPGLMSHDGCAIENGAFFFGGVNASLVPTATIVIYRNHDFIVKQSKPPSMARSGHTCASVGKFVYICFGASKNGLLSDMWKYDCETDQMTNIVPECDEPIEPRSGHSCTVYQNRLYFYGGQGKRPCIPEISVYDTETNRYYVIKDTKGKPPPRTMHSASLLPNGQILIIGGKRERGTCQDVYIYNIPTDTWEHVDSLKISPRFNHRAVCYDRWLFLIGGLDKTKPKSTELIDMRNLTVVGDLKEFGNYPPGLSKFAAVYMEGDKILCFSGTDGVAKYPSSASYVLDFSEGMVNLPVMINARRTTPTVQTFVQREGRDRADTSMKKQPPITLVGTPGKKYVTTQVSLTPTAPGKSQPDEKEADSTKSKHRKHRQRRSLKTESGQQSGALNDDAKTEALQAKPRAHVSLGRRASHKEAPRGKFAGFSPVDLFQSRGEDGVLHIDDFDIEKPQESQESPLTSTEPQDAVVESGGAELNPEDTSAPSGLAPELEPPSEETSNVDDAYSFPQSEDTSEEIIETPSAPVKDATNEPVTSEPVTSEPVTSEAVSETPVDIPQETKPDTEPAPHESHHSKGKKRKHKHEEQRLRLTRHQSDIGRSQPILLLNEPIEVHHKHHRVSKQPAEEPSFPSHFSMEAMCAWLKIDIQNLNMFEQRATTMKLKRLWTLKQANDEEEAKVAKMEVIISGDFSTMPSVPVIMKVYDDSTGMTRIKKINTRDSVEHVNAVIRDTIGRDTLVSVMVSPGEMKDLDLTNLREAYKSIFKGELHSLFVNAI